jgi:hypothetical protein
MKRFLILAAWCVALPSVAQPSSILYTGQDLLNKLGDDRLSAMGYIAGVHDSQSGVTICIPAGRVTLGQMADMVRSSLERVPSERHMAADIYVQVTLSNRWPCSSKRGGGV